MTALALAPRSGHQKLVALWRAGNAPWKISTALALTSEMSVRATAVGDSGAAAVVLGTGTDTSAYFIGPHGTWTRLPRPPARTTSIALPTGPATAEGNVVDVFTVDGGALSVYSLTPSGSQWVRVQSSQVAIPYNSSS
jgi:hypothetical protein